MIRDFSVGRSGILIIGFLVGATESEKRTPKRVQLRILEWFDGKIPAKAIVSIYFTLIFFAIRMSLLF